MQTTLLVIWVITLLGLNMKAIFSGYVKTMKVRSRNTVVIVVLCVILVVAIFSVFTILFNQGQITYKSISVNEVYDYLKDEQKNSVVVLDVRTWQEYNSSHIKWGEKSSEEAIHIPYNQLLANLSAYGTSDCPLTDKKDEFLIVYCLAGSRSTNASETLICNPYANFTNVHNMVDGFRMYFLDTIANPLQANPMANATWDYSDTVVLDSTITPDFKCTTISPTEAYTMVTSGLSPYGFCSVVIDVRDPFFYNESRIVNSTQAPFLEVINLPFEGEETKFLLEIAKYKNETIILYCEGSCQTAGSLCQMLASKGFSSVFVFSGGVGAWSNAGYPIISSGQ